MCIFFIPTCTWSTFMSQQSNINRFNEQKFGSQIDIFLLYYHQLVQHQIDCKQQQNQVLKVQIKVTCFAT